MKLKTLFIIVLTLSPLSSFAVVQEEGMFCHIPGTNNMWCINSQAGADAVNRNNNTNWSPGDFVYGSENNDPEMECGMPGFTLCNGD